LPNVGKSTLFNALTRNNVLAANYPFATIEPNFGIVAIPDERLINLAELYKTESIVPATIKFVDIAGLVSGASNGEGMGNKFLSHIRECSAVCHVVRDFNAGNVTHVNEKVDPVTDIGIVNTELVLADLQTVTNRLNRIEKQANADPKLKPIVEITNQAKQYLENNTPLFMTKDLDIGALWDLSLLTAKPMIYLFNVDEATLNNQSKQEALRASVGNTPCLFINAQLEHELNGLEPSDAKELLESYGQTESGLNQLIKVAYKLLSLQSFLTAGPKEVRAWTIKTGSTAPQAAGIIHGDFERGFIAADIVDYNDLMTAGSLNQARALGKVRTEGKTYVMQPNDVVEFKFNV